ncbi:hypothetical protein [Exiguobacterium sp. 8A]|uniref:hypothetical protein n=1 Tax=Exiguobacterium sp. 8A TaxID=2653139 RepID=UPI001F18D474|nr:hypothetical protein [Exiguobacterium sp. 8A]
MQYKLQTVAYVRVSSSDQNLDRQLEAIGDVNRETSPETDGRPAHRSTAADQHWCSQGCRGV